MNPKSDVTFTQQQLAYLESMFPSIVMGPQTPEANMHHYFGQQSVLRAVRIKTRGQSIQDIPAPR